MAGLPAKPVKSGFLGGLVLLLAIHSPARAGEAGAGFFVTADGYFATTYRAVAGAEPVLILDREQGTLPARIVAVDPKNDLALLKAEGVFTAIPIVASGALKAGDRVYAANSRGAAEPDAAAPLLEGRVSGVSALDGARTVVRITLPVGPGETGAPLLTADGDAVGVIASGRFPGPTPRGSGAPLGDGGYAIRSEYLMALIAGEQPAAAQLLSPGAMRTGETGPEADGIGRAIAAVVSGAAEPPDSGQPDGGEILAAETFAIGTRALLEQDYPAAARWLREAARGGHAGAQTALAGMYENALGMARDDAAAVKWYRSAALRGDAEARARLGMMYARGRGVARDDDEAVDWFRQAAEDGNALGQNFLGVMYRDGRGVYRDDAQAARWFRLAALQGNPEAQNNLGAMFRDGRGVEQDEVEAAWWFRRSADQNNADAQASLGLMYREGRGVHQDDAEAVRWFRRAAEQDHALAAYYLGLSYAEGRGASRNDQEAARWMRESARQGLALAQDYLRGLEN